jgi:hypothetical protein
MLQELRALPLKCQSILCYVHNQLSRLECGIFPALPLRHPYATLQRVLTGGSTTLYNSTHSGYQIWILLS